MAKATFIKSSYEAIYAVASAGSPVAAGDVIVLASNIVVVAGRDIPAGGEGVVYFSGVFEFPASSLTVATGAKLYWDASNGVATTTSTSNTYLGVAANTVTAGSSVQVILNI